MGGTHPKVLVTIGRTANRGRGDELMTDRQTPSCLARRNRVRRPAGRRSIAGAYEPWEHVAVRTRDAGRRLARRRLPSPVHDYIYCRRAPPRDRRNRAQLSWSQSSTEADRYLANPSLAIEAPMDRLRVAPLKLGMPDTDISGGQSRVRSISEAGPRATCPRSIRPRQRPRSEGMFGPSDDFHLITVLT